MTPSTSYRCEDREGLHESMTVFGYSAKHAVEAYCRARQHLYGRAPKHVRVLTPRGFYRDFTVQHRTRVEHIFTVEDLK